MRRLVPILTALALAAALPLVVSAGAGAATFPAGFTDTLVATVSLPTALAQLPDGRILVTNKLNAVNAVTPDGDVQLGLISLPNICATGEQGLNGIAVDPDFTTTGWVFVYYTRPVSGSCAGGTAVNRVSRFTYNGSTFGSELPIVDNIPTIGNNHNGGYVYVANDRLVYISTGDGGGGTGDQNGQNNLTGLNGKILRVNREGAVPLDNPFVGNGAFNPRTYAYGLRNPYRLAFKADDPGVRFRINDVGDQTWEEVSEGIAGANYGWAVREGPCNRGAPPTGCGDSPYEDPVAWYQHDGAQCGGTITGGAFVPDGAWAGYDGAYLFGEFCRTDLYVQFAGQSGSTFELLSGDVGQLIDMKFVQEGGRWVLYYTTFANGGELHRVTGPPPAPPPTPSGTAKFVPVPPQRILDTRINLGVSGPSPVPGQTAITLPVVGQGIVPSGATAVAINVTGDNSASDGFVTVWPSGQPRPTASTLNFSGPDDEAANEAVVPLGANGAIDFFTQYSADLIADITGYWVPADASTDGRFVAVDPARILDTRSGLGAPAGKVPTAGQIDVQVTGAGGIPTTGVSAVAVTVTFDDADFAGFVTVWPTGSIRPFVSNLNPTEPGDIRANLVIVPVGADGKLSLYTISPVHLIMDVAGWFTDGSAPSSGSGLLRTVVPTRLLDTRELGATFDRLEATEEGTKAIGSVVTGSVQAVFQNLTITETAGAAFHTARPGGTPLPTASNVNATGPDQNRAALALTRVGPPGTITYYAGANAHDLVVDISAWIV